ncbi:MAG: hypothetical protein KF816_03330 [Melioribacteraceae bacterium]|nr:hypothetical protein [Melioribacteraceae bacterium]
MTKKHLITLGLIIFIVSFSIADINAHRNVSSQFGNKPWTYWWWLGSAVDSANITYSLENFKKAGIGGVHIIPIYGVKGFEEKFINFLSPQWMEMLSHTANECERIGIGLDMTIGTGWPFGGAQVSSQHSSSQLIDLSFNVSNGELYIDLFNEASTKYGKKGEFSLIAVNSFMNGKVVDLKNYVSREGILNWKSDNDKCKIIALISVSSIQQVKRAAPGAKGNVVDPFSVDALNNYLSYFDEAFTHYNGKMVRSFYHDSYEYYGADWTNNFLQEFKNRRGYNFIEVLPEFLGYAEEEIVSRVKTDYRHTFSELHENFISEASKWSNAKGAMFRNQAHGSPTNLLDTYSAADIPECEIFGAPKLTIPGLTHDPKFSREEFVDPLILKFSSSAANVSGKNLISSETGTWIAEHFREKLSHIKPEIDLLFYSGVNHIFFHGIPYSPKNIDWPGWKFYATTDYGPFNSLWNDLPSLTKYIERCQSILRAGQPDNDILLYFPIWDLWHSPIGKLIHLQIHEPEDWLYKTSFYDIAKILFEKGFSFDYISDKQIEGLKIKDDLIYSNSNSYKTIIIPPCRFMPLETMEKLDEFINAGGSVIFLDGIPEEIPGLFEYRKRTIQLLKVKERILENINVKKISIVEKKDLSARLNIYGVNREHLSDYSINYIRRKNGSTKYYFIVNQQSMPINDWINFNHISKNTLITDPLTGNSGIAKTKINNDSTISVYLQLEPGKSLILKMSDDTSQYPNWNYLQTSKEYFNITGHWNVEFIKGGPVLLNSMIINKLESWTNFDDPELKRFAGTARYKIKFDNPDSSIKNWILDLGKVCESARIKINNIDVGILWSFPMSIPLNNILKKGENELIIEVTNLSANRIKDLDTRGVNWKKFYDINFVNIHYKKFDASDWDLVDSGLLGPIRLIPTEIIKF